MKVLHINSYYALSHFYKHLYMEQIRDGINIDVYVPVSGDFNECQVDYGKFTAVKNHWDNFRNIGNLSLFRCIYYFFFM